MRIFKAASEDAAFLLEHIMAADFPTVQKPAKRTKTFQHKQQKRKFESGKVSSRKVFTSGVWQWKLSWDYLPLADCDAIKEHFNTWLGSVFSCSAEMLGMPKNYQVRYNCDSLKIESSKVPGFFKLNVELEEAL